MRHGRARRLLTGLLDGTLPARSEFRLRRHLAGCARCRSALLAFEASDALLRRLPRSIVPLWPTPDAEARLAVLARWGGPRTAPAAVGARERPADRAPAWGVSAAGIALAAAGLAAMILVFTPQQGAEDGSVEHEPFNFVLASSFEPASGAAVRGRMGGTGAAALAVAGASRPSDAVYLPIGPL